MELQRKQQTDKFANKLLARKNQARKNEKAKMDTSSDSESDDQYDLKGLRALAKESAREANKSDVNLIEGHAINADPNTIE